MSEAIKFYPQLKSAFTGGIAPVGVTLNKTQPYVESNYSLPSFSQCKYLLNVLSGVVVTYFPSISRYIGQDCVFRFP